MVGMAAVAALAVVITGSSPARQEGRPASVLAPAGTFLMGCVPADRLCEATEHPRRSVTLTRAFRLATTETTIAHYRRFVTATGYRTEAEKRGRGRFWRFDIDEWDWIDGLSWRAPFAPDEPGADDWPAVQIAWNDANAYCRWTGGRLPTEAEWEYAARGGRRDSIHVWGDDPLPAVGEMKQANGPDESTAREFRTFSTFREYNDGYARVAPVASFAANGFGLHDMAGNVYEWTADWIVDGPYTPGPAVDPKGQPNGVIKAVRGGGWGYPVSIIPAGLFEADLPPRIAAAAVVSTVHHFTPDQRHWLWTMLAERLTPKGLAVVEIQIPSNAPVPRTLFLRTRVGDVDYEGWMQADPIGPALQRWRVRYRALRGGVVLDDQSTSYDMHVVDFEEIARESAAAGLTPVLQGDFAILRRGQSRADREAPYARPDHPRSA